jgi:tetratricopeptide (TPR) repeat protein
VILPALRLAPRNVELLALLGELYLAMEDSGRLEQVIRTLEDINSPQSAQVATGLEAALTNMEGGTEEALRYLEELASGEDASLNARVNLIRARAVAGDTAGALSLARILQEENPDDPNIRAIVAAAELANGNMDAAEAIYRDLVNEDPNRTQTWLQLIDLRNAQGDLAGAVRLLEAALEAQPEDASLLWARASFAERAGNIDEAIAIYERLYQRNTSSVVVANNLASLLSTYRTDDESLERAWTIARRFRDTGIPAIQDTYGWIAHRRGEHEEALGYLQQAAASLPGDPLVQYHLGQVFLSLGQQDEALKQFRSVVDLAGPADQRTQINDARAQVTALEQAMSENKDN